APWAPGWHLTNAPVGLGIVVALLCHLFRLAYPGWLALVVRVGLQEVLKPVNELRRHASQHQTALGDVRGTHGASVDDHDEDDHPYQPGQPPKQDKQHHVSGVPAY